MMFKTTRSPKTIVIIGDGHCGKTSIIRRYVFREFQSDYKPTIFDNYCVSVDVGNRGRKLSIMDLSGQEDWHHIRKQVYPLADLIIVVFDVSNINTLDNVFLTWVPEIDEYGPKVPFILVGNKADIRGTCKSCIDPSVIIRMSETIKARTYLECSALENKGIDDVFQSAAQILYRKTCRIL